MDGPSRLDKSYRKRPFPRKKFINIHVDKNKVWLPRCDNTGADVAGGGAEERWMERGVGVYMGE